MQAQAGLSGAELHSLGLYLKQVDCKALSWAPVDVRPACRGGVSNTVLWAITWGVSQTSLLPPSTRGIAPARRPSQGAGRGSDLRPGQSHHSLQPGSHPLTLSVAPQGLPG